MLKRKTVIRLSVVVALILVLAALFGLRPLLRLVQVMNLFSPDRISYNFSHMDSIFDKETIAASSSPREFPRALRALPAEYRFRGATKLTEEFLSRTGTTALMVLKDGKLVHEAYYQGTQPDSRLISWSLSKSMVSALLGIAIQEGLVESLDKPVDHYVPELAGSGYAGVPLLDVLCMASGIAFDESYSKSESDINRMGRMLALNTPIDDFVLSLKPEMPSGRKLHYVSMDTQVLSMVLRSCLAKAGISFGDYFASRLWQAMGSRDSAYWLVDNQGHELAFGGFNATLGDYARFGQLYLDQGMADSRQVVPADWVKDSTRAQAAFLQPGTELSKSSLGYGYQWWLPFNNDGDFVALGIYSQFIYVYPRHRTVIVKLSAFKEYNQKGSEAIVESIEFFRQLAKNL